MFARKFSSDGDSRWPAPWRARNATRLPRSVPSRYGPDGSPNGVVSVTSFRSVTSAMSYRPLPPMIPICTRSICLRSSVFRLRSSVFGLPSEHLLDVALVVLLSNVACGDQRIVFEEDQVLAV